jgi:hypothetical protein
MNIRKEDDYRDISGKLFIDACFWHNKIQFVYNIEGDELDKKAEEMARLEMITLAQIERNIPRTRPLTDFEIRFAAACKRMQE